MPENPFKNDVYRIFRGKNDYRAGLRFSRYMYPREIQKVCGLSFFSRMFLLSIGLSIVYSVFEEHSTL